jgi:hypothetical protein
VTPFERLVMRALLVLVRCALWGPASGDEGGTGQKLISDIERDLRG